MVTPIYYPPSENGLQKTIGSDLSTGVTASMTLNNANQVQNKPGVVVVDRIDSTGTLKLAADREYIAYTGTSGSTLTGLIRGVGNSTDQDHGIGAVVEFVPDITIFEAIAGALATVVLTTDVATVNTTNIVTPAGTQTLTNKTLTSPVMGGTITGTGITDSSTSTMTNKRITERVVTTTDDSTAVIDVGITDQYQLTAVANATTFTVTGTPTAGQKLIVRFKDAGVAKALTWTGFTSKGATLPTTTVASKEHYVGLIYNLTATTWDCVAAIVEA